MMVLSEQADERSRGLQAFSIIKRIKAKMHGTDFAPPEKEKDATGKTAPPPMQVALSHHRGDRAREPVQIYLGWNLNWALHHYSGAWA